MTEIMKRGGNDVDCQGIKFQVPSNQMAIGIIATNRIQDGDSFRNDGWVYGTDGERRRKWFRKLIRCDDARIWLPKLKDIKNLERLRWKAYEKLMSISQPAYEKLRSEILKEGKFGGMRNGEKLIFNKYKSDEINWAWGDEECPMNQELSDQWFRYRSWSEVLANRFYLFNYVFMEAIHKNYTEIFLKKGNPYASLKLTVNNRIYWFKQSSTEYSDHFFEKLSFPEDQTDITIDV